MLVGGGGVSFCSLCQQKVDPGNKLDRSNFGRRVLFFFPAKIAHPIQFLVTKSEPIFLHDKHNQVQVKLNTYDVNKYNMDVQ